MALNNKSGPSKIHLLIRRWMCTILDLTGWSHPFECQLDFHPVIVAYNLEPSLEPFFTLKFCSKGRERSSLSLSLECGGGLCPEYHPSCQASKAICFAQLSLCRPDLREDYTMANTFGEKPHLETLENEMDCSFDSTQIFLQLQVAAAAR